MNCPEKSVRNYHFKLRKILISADLIDTADKAWSVVLCIVCFVSFYVLFVCKCVLYFCHRVTTQLQLTNISYHILSPACIQPHGLALNSTRTSLSFKISHYHLNFQRFFSLVHCQFRWQTTNISLNCNNILHSPVVTTADLTNIWVYVFLTVHHSVDLFHLPT